MVLSTRTDPNAWRLARVRSVAQETGRAATIRFEVPGWPGHLAGQRIDVRLTAEDGYSTTRSYSMAAPWQPAAPGGGTVDITVEAVDDGEVSPYLVGEVRPGDELELRGPIGGAFTWSRGDGGPLLLVGGGSGLVPLMAMVRAHALAAADGRDRDRRASETDVSVIVSARTAADLLYAEELQRLSEAGTIAFHPTLTRATPEGWPGGSGRIDATFLQAKAPQPHEAPMIFVCGSNAFVETAVGALLAIGHDARAIRTERYGPAAG